MNEDAVLMAIGGLTRAVEDQGREIHDMKSAITDQGKCCRDCRKDIDRDIEAQATLFNDRIDKENEKIKTLQDLHLGEKAVGSWIDNGLGRAGNVLGIVSILIVVTSGIMTFITWVWPLLQKIGGS